MNGPQCINLLVAIGLLLQTTFQRTFLCPCVPAFCVHSLQTSLKGSDSTFF